jgi:RNA polymerase sigma factor (sigma-70 family)
MSETGQAVRRIRAVPDDAAPPADSFEAFFQSERDGLFGALVLITGSRSEAEEIAQDAFVAVWQRWERVAAMDRPSGYLYRTAMNAFRKRRRRAAVALRRLVERSPERDAFETADAREVVRATLARLSTRQRAALVLTELLEFSSEEASRALGITAGTVRALASQGRSAMRDALRWGDDDE